MGEIISTFKKLRRPNFQSELMSMIVTFAAISIAVTFISLQYFSFNPLPSVFFASQDYWCPGESSPPLGNHCFGDFGIMMEILSQPNPWSNSTGFAAYPGGGVLWFLPFFGIFKISGSFTIACAAYLIMSALSLSLPGLVLAKGQRWFVKSRNVALTLMAFPALASLDRGNSIVFAVPALTLLFHGLKSANRNLITVATVALILIKPHFVLLLIVVYLTSGFRWLGKSVVAVVALSVMPYILWWQNFPGNIHSSITNMLGYQNYQNLANPWPVNVSLLRPLFWLEFIGQSLVGGGTNVHSLSVDSFKNYFSVAHASALSWALIGLISILILITHKTRDVVVTAMMLVITACLGPAVSYSYYLVFCLPIVAVLFSGSTPVETSRFLEKTKFATRILLASLALSIVRIPLPLPFPLANQTLILTTAELVPLGFLTYMTLSLAFSIKELARGSAKSYKVSTGQPSRG